jgi:hypothetical protein
METAAMHKLIVEFNRDRCEAKARKLLAYLDKHPMAICMASSCDCSIIELARKLVRC